MIFNTKHLPISCALLLLAETPVQAAPCLNYSEEVILQGAIKRQIFPEQPNYESIAKGDAKASYFFISPHKSFCVLKGSDLTEEAEQGVKEVQLIFSEPKKSYRQLRPYLGKEVKCSGQFFHAISGHHHSSVLLDKAVCHPIRESR
jgi:hypothetical protein